MRTKPRLRQPTAAFSRTDLLAVLAAVTLLLVVAFAGCRGASDKANTLACASNLERLGKAFQFYAKDHDDALPPARLHYSDRSQHSWDTFLKPYLTHTLPATNSALAARKRDRELGKLLHCPSDTLPRAGAGGPRSYAMSAHDMRQKNWPPGPNNSTGVGLSWTFGPKGDKPPPERVYNFKETNKQAVIKISMLPSPKDTLLLTELIATNNGAWRSPRSAIRYTGEHLNTNQMNPLVFHDGTINYLMVDGHVETLQPSQTVGPTGQAGTNAAKHFGIWTIKAGD